MFCTKCGIECSSHHTKRLICKECFDKEYDEEQKVKEKADALIKEKMKGFKISTLNWGWSMPGCGLPNPDSIHLAEKIDEIIEFLGYHYKED